MRIWPYGDAVCIVGKSESVKTITIPIFLESSLTVNNAEYTKQNFEKAIMH